MKCELIFYYSGKTRLCETALERSLADTGLRLCGSRYAADPEALGRELINAFDAVNVVFIVGDSAAELMSCALADKAPDDVKKLRGRDADGFLVRCKGQLLVILPDSPGEISEIFGEELLSYFGKFTET